jgi:pyruvate formate lyase activating enzyme
MKKILFVFIFQAALLLQITPCSLESVFAEASKSPQAKEALYYDKLDNKKVVCVLCPRRCAISNNARGFCRVRENRDGILRSLVYAKPCAVHVDPIEKKPLFHVLPGTKSFSIATVGCNMACKFCQNWQISQASPEDVRSRYMPPEEVVQAAKASGSATIAYTYTEPTVFYEYVLDTAKLATGEGMLNVIITNGFINEEPLRELSKYIDAANVDLKGSDRFYTDICLGTRSDVLRTLKVLKEEGVWVEITYLLIPSLNDDTEYIEETAIWIKENLGPGTPLHISRFWPMYKIRNLSPTPIEALYNARDIAVSSGLNHVYIGNIPGTKAESTYCPDCSELLIKRVGYNVIENNIKEGKCINCNSDIAGIWSEK